MDIRVLEDEIKNLEKVNSEAKRHIRKSEKHNLTTRKIRGCYRYYLDDKYAGKDKLGTVKALAEQEYYRKLLKDTGVLLEKAKSYKMSCEKHNPCMAFRSLHEGKRKLITPMVDDIDELIEKFEKEEYKGLPFEENQNVFYTAKGECVRSKTEKIIADTLHRKGIHYKYERPLELEVSAGQKKLFYPDFTVMRKSNGRIVYIEHFGMLDNPSYYNNTLNKLNVFEKNNLLIGSDVLIIHETSYAPINTKVLEMYIDMFLY